MFCGMVSTVTTRVRMLSFGLDTAQQSFCLWLIALPMIIYITLFTVNGRKNKKIKYI